MQLLTWLTVIYLVVLVLALAVSLTTIFYYLWRIGTALAAVRDRLAQAERNTAPLKDHLKTINEGLASVGEGLRAVDEHLFETNESLGGVAGRLGIGSQSR